MIKLRNKEKSRYRTTKPSQHRKYYVPLCKLTIAAVVVVIENKNKKWITFLDQILSHLNRGNIHKNYFHFANHKLFDKR